MAFSRLFTFFTAIVLATTALSALLDAAAFANTSFDFIIVGGGTAGVAVAVRLSEIAHFTVGIIEAGTFHPDDPLLAIPQAPFAAAITANPAYSWNFNSVPQAKLNNRSLFMSRGKVLGGSSAISLMGVGLTSAVEYDQIGQLGNPGWSYKNTLKYYKKATNMSVAPPELQEETHATFLPAFHGNSGPIKTSYSAWFSKASPLFYDTMVGLGFAPVKDGADGRDANAVFNPTVTVDQDTKTRSYSARGYYLPNAGRPNLHLLTNAQVIKLNLSPAADFFGNYNATGIIYVSNGTTYTATVRKDVILSAGSIQSPHILELSGIGNKTILEAAGVKSIIDLPSVGENYQDHLINTISFKIPSTIETWDVFGDPTKNATAFSEYETNRTGPYTGSISAVAFASATKFSDNQTQLSQWLASIDKQFYASNPSRGRREVYKMERQRLVWNNPSAAIEMYCVPGLTIVDFFEPNTSFVELITTHSHPFSRGSIHLNSSDPFIPPLIDLNAWAFDVDKAMTIQGVKYARKVTQTAPFSGLIQSAVYPGANVTTDEDLGNMIAESTTYAYHATGTSAMLPKALGGVVDPTLKVYGTRNIRVVDISILPFNLASLYAGTTYAIAEQAADMIKVAHGCPIFP